MFVVLTIVTLAILDRSAAWLWRLRPVWGLMWMLVLVLPWFVAIFWRAGETFFADSLGGDMLSKIRRAGIPRRAARALSAAVLGDVLAGRAAGGHGGAGGVAGAARARRAVSAGLADPVLDRVRTGADQAAALRAAALSGDRDPDGRRAGAPRAVAIAWLMRGAAWWFVIPAGASVLADRRRDRADAPAGVSGLAVRRGGADLRAVRVVAVRRQPRRTLAAECRGRGDVSGDCRLRRRGAGADAAVSERRDRARAAQRRLRRTEGRRRRLSRAEPRVHDRHLDAADRWLGRRRFPGAGQLPVRAGGIAFGTQLSPQRAEAIGLRYNVATRIDGYNFSQGKAISIAIFRSEGTE